MLKQFERCPRENIPFDKYKFHQRTQESGETDDQYHTALRRLSDSYDFQAITHEAILQDRLVLGILPLKCTGRLQGL